MTANSRPCPRATLGEHPTSSGGPAKPTSADSAGSSEPAWKLACFPAVVFAPMSWEPSHGLGPGFGWFLASQGRLGENWGLDAAGSVFKSHLHVLEPRKP